METERILLRQFTISDSDKCFENFGQDVSIGKYIPIFPFDTVDKMKSVIKDFSCNKNIWLLIEKTTSLPMGYITVDIPYDELKIAEIGYVLGSRFRNKGYGMESVNRILHYLFNERDIYLVEAKVNEHNIASIKLLKNIGFKEEAHLRGRRIDTDTGERNDLIVYSLLHNEYRD